MGQTVEIFPKAKSVFKYFFHSKKIKKISNKILSYFVDYYAKLKDFHFPAKFSWDWKMEMLMRKYEAETVDLFKKIIKPGMTVVDIGAHVGYFSILFSELVGKEGKVLAFEPDPANFNILKLNAENRKNIETFNLAVSDKEGSIDFYETLDKTGSHSLIPSDFRSNKITVNSITLDNFLSTKKIKVDVIKMDIEGAEPLALVGMVNTLKNEVKLVMEFCPNNLTLGGFIPQQIFDQIKSLNLSMRLIKKNSLEEFTKSSIDSLEDEKNGYSNILISHE